MPPTTVKWSGKTSILHRPPQRSIELVVARYNEDLAWTDKHHNFRTVYNKGSEPLPGTNPLPNVGREAHTYLTHIVENYDDLAERTLFAQGSLTDHGGDFLHKLIKVDQGFAAWCSVIRTQDRHRYWTDDGFIRHIGKWKKEIESGQMRPATLSYPDWFERYVAADGTRSLTYSAFSEFHIWPPGAVFCVHRDHIIDKPKWYYERLLSTVSDHVNPEEAHYLERSWTIIFIPRDGRAYTVYPAPDAPPFLYGTRTNFRAKLRAFYDREDERRLETNRSRPSISSSTPGAI